MKIFYAKGKNTEKIYAIGNSKASIFRRLQILYAKRKFGDKRYEATFYPETLRIEEQESEE